MSKSSFRATLMLWLVLGITVWNIIRFWTSLLWRNVLLEFSGRANFTIATVGSGVWILTGMILFWSIRQKKAWAGKLLLGTSAAYSVWYWCGRIFWQETHPNWPFAVILNLILMTFVIFATNSFPRQAYGKKSKNKKIERP